MSSLETVTIKIITILEYSVLGKLYVYICSYISKI